jgi:flagellar biosynthesis component FlhA
MKNMEWAGRRVLVVAKAGRIMLKAGRNEPSRGMTIEAFLDLVYRSSFWLAAVIFAAILAYIVYKQILSTR